MTTVRDTIDHVTLVRLVEAGAVHSANIIGQAGGWEVVIMCGLTERALAAKRGSVRTFRKFETLVGYLKGLGVAKYQVDAAGFDPVALKLSRGNEAAHDRLKAAHQANAYDKWFREEVQKSLDDPRPSISDAEVEKHFAAKRKKIQQSIKTAA